MEAGLASEGNSYWIDEKRQIRQDFLNRTDEYDFANLVAAFEEW